MNLLSIDPGCANQGLAVFSNDCLVTSWTETLSMEQSDASRLWQTAQLIRKAVKDYNIQEMAIESFFAGHYSKSAIDIPETIGVIKATAGGLAIPIFAYPPSTIKKRLTNNGRCKKQEVIEAVAKRVGGNFSISEHHEADAIAVGFCHLELIDA